ncbi:MAG TPA: uroporphyrinogen-III synthase [Gaiellaceae bacterium]|nr:uroporphyrinogen-III synthase [Gaiellaceae bacterium]
MPALRVLVTRPREHAQALVEALASEGFDVVVEPLIAIEPLSDEPIDVRGYDCVIVTSANGARELARRMNEVPSRIAAIGPGTLAALDDAGLCADVVADVHTQEGLVDALSERPQRALFVGAEGARGYLAEALDADFLPVYRTIELSVDALPAADVAVLMSPSAARAYARAGGRGPAVTIGPQTTSAAQAADVDVVAEARSQDVRGLVDSAAAWRASSRS